MEVGLIRRIDIDDEMQQSYLDYAMSVIVARALPDARDGLKPVHRRILYSMYAQGIRPEGEFRKSARIVGEVLGKYHPHGDMAVYDAMARMAQAFSMRYPLVEGQGNFGSMDGDPAAAMRYTEARLAPLSLEMIRDIEKETVAQTDNFDGTMLEPVVLPAAIPNMLANGSTGIAVGMATSIPPHNMTEVCSALIFMLEKWDQMDTFGLEDLMGIIKGPDFPTGGLILDEGDTFGENLLSAYRSGRGRISVRARTHIESMGRGRSRIIVSELPFQTNKAGLIQRIADLVRGDQIPGITDLRDESDRSGMRIVIELLKTADPEEVLGLLFKKTPMQSTFSVIMLALVEGEPRLLTLKQALKVYLDHRVEVVRKRSEFDLERASQRAHIVEGLLLAIKNLDEVIATIRRSADTETAYQRLRKKYSLSDAQARAILDMPLKRLATLERKNLNSEFRELKKQIKALEGLLSSEAEIRGVVSEELERTKSTYGDRRRTQIVLSPAGKTASVVITPASASMSWIVLDDQGRLSRSGSTRLPRLAGTHPPALVLEASGRDHLYLFSQDGQCVCVPVHTLPVSKDPSQGSPFEAVTPLDKERGVATGFAIDPKQLEAPGTFILATEGGMLKRSDLDSLPGPSSAPFVAMKIDQGDRLRWAAVSAGQEDIFIGTSAGMGIRFAETEARTMGLVAGGVKGVRLGKKERVVGMCAVTPKTPLFFLTDRGDAKRIRADQFPQQGRYGKGVRVWKSGENPTFIGLSSGDRGIAVLKKGAARSIRFSQVPLRTRQAGGQALFELAARNAVTTLRSAIKRPSPQKAAGESKASSKKKRPAAQRGTKAKPKAKKKSTRKRTTSKSRKKKSSKR